MHENKAKGQTLARFSGTGSRKAAKQLEQSHLASSTTARYLGPFLHWKGSNKPELRRRVSGAWASWWAYRRFWSASVSTRLKLNVFKAVVVSTLLSGMISFVLTTNDIQQLSVPYYKMLRKLMCGKAADKTGQHITSISNHAVSKQLGMPSVTATLHAQRVRFWQSLFADPLLHKQVLAAMFGHMTWDDYDQPPPRNPWAQQCYEDLQLLSWADDLSEVLQQISFDMHRLLSDKELREQFVQWDASVIEKEVTD